MAIVVHGVVVVAFVLAISSCSGTCMFVAFTVMLTLGSIQNEILIISADGRSAVGPFAVCTVVVTVGRSAHYRMKSISFEGSACRQIGIVAFLLKCLRWTGQQFSE